MTAEGLCVTAAFKLQTKYDFSLAIICFLNDTVQSLLYDLTESIESDPWFYPVSTDT